MITKTTHPTYKTIYLTIDESPSKDICTKLYYLQKYKIPAIIFCIGERVQQHRDALLKVIEMGFIIGNHSYTHPRLSRIDLTSAQQEIILMDRLIDDLYDEAGVKQPARLFRFPYGDRGGENAAQLQELLLSMEYKQPLWSGVNYSFFREHTASACDIFWTYNVMEYDFVDESDIGKRFANKVWQLGKEVLEPGGWLESDSNEVMIIHDEEETSSLFFKIIDQLVAKGFEFKLPQL
ncbi:MAG: polysaccharide deacetylase family protein [Symploca sp. SIO3E6]|nr:polysaccharide deacetylase family protein [Caldora sp. SIO3E6]